MRNYSQEIEEAVLELIKQAQLFAQSKGLERLHYEDIRNIMKYYFWCFYNSYRAAILQSLNGLRQRLKVKGRPVFQVRVKFLK